VKHSDHWLILGRWYISFPGSASGFPWTLQGASGKCDPHLSILGPPYYIFMNLGLLPWRP